MIRALHHMAFRCRDSEATRAFYEDVIGLDFAAALELEETKTGRPVRALHTFFRMQDGAFIAFFEVPDMSFAFKAQHDFDLHLALEVAPEELERARTRGRSLGLDVRGPSDHGFIRSIYFTDPNGYVVELTAKTPAYDAMMAKEQAVARDRLAAWSRANKKTEQLAP